MSAESILQDDPYAAGDFMTRMRSIRRFPVSRQIPNALSSMRIGLALEFPRVQAASRLPLLLGALATEYLDGKLARTFSWQSRVGQVLDPVADKVLFVAVAGTLLREKRIRWTDLLAWGARDLTVAAGALIVMKQQGVHRIQEMKPGILGKVTTAAQYAAFFSALTNSRLRGVLTRFTLVFGVAAAVEYAIKFQQKAPKT